MTLRLPEWAIRTMKYTVICTLSGLILLIAGIALFALIYTIYHQETDLHTIVSPDKQWNVTVTRLDYGQPCGNGIAFSAKLNNGFARNIFRDPNACDGSAKWLNAHEVSIESISSTGAKLQTVIIDMDKINRYYD